jgi:hypothetical protein
MSLTKALVFKTAQLFGGEAKVKACESIISKKGVNTKNQINICCI